MSEAAKMLVLECLDCSETWSFENCENGYNRMIAAGSNHVVDSDCDTVLESAVFQEHEGDREIRADGGNSVDAIERAFSPICPNCEADGRKQRVVNLRRVRWICTACGERYSEGGERNVE